MAKGKKSTKEETALQAVEPSAEALSLFGPSTEGKKPKKGEEEVFDRQAQVMALTASINSQFKGRAVLRQGSEITNVFILRRPTGITTLDLALGGGIPAGGLTQVIGKYSSGKSYLANRIMATAQSNYKENFAASVNMTEMRYDKNFAKWQCGLRIAMSEAEIAVLAHINRQHGHPEFTDAQVTWLRDQVGTFVEGVAGTAEQILEVAVQQVESNLFQIVLIDSFGALLTAAEAEADEGLEQKHRGGAAMVVTQFMHRLHAALNLPDKYGRPNTTTVIGINQYRDNVNAGLYGNPMKVAGGNALAHGKLVDIHIEQGAKIRVPISSKENRVVGKEINWEIMKGKAGCHDGPKGTYKFYFGEHGFPFGIDIYSDLISAGLQAEVIEQSGSWFAYNGEKLGQGESNAAVAIHSNPDLLQSIRMEIFKKAGLNFIVTEGI
jgi:recombination protein RecA